MPAGPRGLLGSAKGELTPLDAGGEGAEEDDSPKRAKSAQSVTFKF